MIPVYDTFFLSHAVSVTQTLHLCRMTSHCSSGRNDPFFGKKRHFFRANSLSGSEPTHWSSLRTGKVTGVSGALVNSRWISQHSHMVNFTKSVNSWWNSPCVKITNVISHFVKFKPSVKNMWISHLVKISMNSGFSHTSGNWDVDSRHITLRMWEIEPFKRILESHFPESNSRGKTQS